MSSATTIETLKQIKDLYGSIKQVSILLVDNFNEETLEDSLRTRENLLKEIYRKEAEYTRLKKANTADPMEYIQLKNEISDLIRFIISLDSRISEKISNNMKSIRQELSGLHGSSKAALAYSSQRRS